MSVKLIFGLKPEIKLIALQEYLGGFFIYQSDQDGERSMQDKINNVEQ